MNSKRKRLIKDIFVFGLGSIGSKLILFFLVPLYTNYMTRAEYGTADLVFTISQLLVPLISVTVFDAVVRFGLMKSERQEDVLLCAFVVLGCGSIAMLLITPLLSFYAAVAPWRWYLCIYTVLSIAVYIELNYLKVQDKNMLYSVISILQTLLLALMNVLLIVYFQLGIKGYLLSNIIASAAAFVSIFAVGHIGRALKNAELRKDLLKKMLAYSAPLILNNVSWWIIHSSDKVMLELMIGAAALGVYTVAAKIPSLINVFISIFSQAWGLSSIREIEETEDNSFYTEVFSAYCTFVFIIAAILITVIRPFMKIYVGPDFQNAWQYVPFLLVSAVFSAIAAFYGSMYAALKKSRNNMWTTLAAAFVNVILNYIFIRMVGIWGAVIGTVAAYITVATARAADVQRFIRIDVSWPRFALSCAFIIAQAFAVSSAIAPYAISLISLAALAVINKDELKSIATRTAKMIKE